jgi:hypothetical protein
MATGPGRRVARSGFLVSLLAWGYCFSSNYMCSDGGQSWWFSLILVSLSREVDGPIQPVELSCEVTRVNISMQQGYFSFPFYFSCLRPSRVVVLYFLF